MLDEHNRKSNIGIGLGILCQVLGIILNIPLISMLLIFGGLGLFIYGCGQYAEAKGHSWGWGVLGFFSIIGLLILYFLPDRTKPGAPTPPSLNL